MEPIDLSVRIRSYLAALLLGTLSDFDRNKLVAFAGIDPAAPADNWFFDNQVSYLSDAIVEWMGPQADPFFLDLYLLANRGFPFLTVDYRVGAVYLDGSTPEERARSARVVDQRASDLDAKNREVGSDEWLERFFNKDIRQEIHLAPGETFLSSKYTEMARRRMGPEIESFARMVLLPRVSYQDKTTAYLLWFTVRPAVDFREQVFAEFGEPWPATKALPAAFLVPPRRTTPLDRPYLANGHLP